MNIAVGMVLGLGALLIASPFIWPREGASSRTSRGVFAPLGDLLAGAGLQHVSIATFLALSVIVATAGSAVAFAVLPVGVVAALVGATTLAAPWFAIRWRATSRRRAARIVWPDVVDHLISAVRSGLALPDGIVTLAHAGPMATRDVFAGFERDYRASGNFGESLDRAKSAIADPIADRIIEILRMSREVGGSELTIVLRNLGSYLRQESAIRMEVAARQSWVLNAARLGVAAPWIVLLMLLSRPEAAAAYNSTAGTLVIVSGLAVTVVAYRIMIAIGAMPEERRWFR